MFDRIHEYLDKAIKKIVFFLCIAALLFILLSIKMCL